MYVFSAKLFSMIDLHTHSTASDGTLSPRELVRLAASSQLDAVAITDHDTLDGLEEALEAGKEFGIEVIPSLRRTPSSFLEGRRSYRRKAIAHSSV